jgi:glucuronate isomerase
MFSFFRFPMVSYPDFQTKVLALPVFDTHTHLGERGVAVPAQNVWDILHYFWFFRELVAAGYPANAKSLPEDQRIPAFLDAFAATRHTTMNWVVRHIFSDLYDVELTDEASVRQADEAVRASAARDDWSADVCDRLGIRNLTTNFGDKPELEGLPGRGCLVPVRLGVSFPALRQQLRDSVDRLDAERVTQQINDTVAGLAAQGIRGVRADASAFLADSAPIDTLSPAEPSDNEIDRFLAGRLFAALAEHGMFAQLFLGVGQDGSGTAVPLPDPRTVTSLHGAFAHYGCDFELIIGSAGNNLDAVQAARIFPNVHVGGMWWYNFRQSTYLESMAQRIEALPACKSTLVVSDARCIEWAYGKVLFIKTILAQFLYERWRQGWLDEAEALRVAREWLHDAAQRRYLPQA